MNIRDIAQLANVTPGTVSKVLNNYPDISDATRQLVLKVIEENKYKPSTCARLQKAYEATPSIGLVLEGVNNGIHESMEEMLSIRLHNGDFTVLKYNDNYFSQDKTEKFQELISYGSRHKLNGMIYFGGNFENVSESVFNSLPCPVVFVNTMLPDNMEETRYSSIQVNHYETAYRQMKYLINKGHKNICTLISSNADTSIYSVRVKAYKDALKDSELTGCLNYIIEGDYTSKRSYDSVLKLLQDRPEITAVCCIADIVAPAVIRAIHDVGKEPGKDVEVISFDGLQSINYCIPSVTTFAQPKADLVICIYDLLMGLIKKERSHQHITFQTKLIPNESC